MTKLLSRLFAIALVMGLSAVPTLTHAEDGNTQGAEEEGKESAGDSKEEPMMEKLEDVFKETTTPTDEETNPIGTTEDTDRDLF